MKRKNAKTINVIQKTFVQVILLCMMIILETIIIFKMRIQPENANRATMIVFLTATTIPAMMNQNKIRISDLVGYFFAVMIIWSTIELGLFDCQIENVSQIAKYVLISFAFVLATKLLLDRKAAPKHQRCLFKTV